MGKNRRTTVVADADDLAVVAIEARSRGMSLGAMLGELVAQGAKEFRQKRRPRLATFRAQGSIAALMEKDDEPAARPFRS